MDAKNSTTPSMLSRHIYTSAVLNTANLLKDKPLAAQSCSLFHRRSLDSAVPSTTFNTMNGDIILTIGPGSPGSPTSPRSPF
jgi:hypothetical protein